MTDATDANTENPFPAQAVMTFGQLPKRPAELKFMTDAFEPVEQYLIAYSKADLAAAPTERSALGLSGEHGSGKTFLLAWIRDKVADFKSLPAKVAYAKADTPLFVDIYRQLLRNFTLPVMQEVVGVALRRIAIQRTGAAAASEGRSRELVDGAALETAYDEKILDRNELYLDLKQRIAKAGAAAIADTVAQTIGLLDDPDLGRAAFDWLCGADPGEPRLPGKGPLLPMSAAETSADAADIAVGALECIAALFAAAGMPLILMVDQLETFANSNVPVAFWSSMIKKFAEQVRRQNGLMIFAGTRLVWDRMPRDVTPRLIGRDKFSVGNLNRKEAEVLLDAYHPDPPRFGSTTIDTIHRLSGGSTREILQIAFRCWRDTDGHLDKANDTTVLNAARDGGTLLDRSALAIAEVDRVLERVGLVGRELRLAGGELVDRLATAPGGTQSVAIVLAPATDPLHEVAAAQGMTQIREALEAVPGKPSLLVVPIGYSSDSVKRLLNDISWVVPFDGGDFEPRLQVAINQMTVVAPVAPAEASPTVDSVLQRLAVLQTSLEDLRNLRTDRVMATSERLVQGTDTLADAEREQREARTKWEIVDGLEHVMTALDRHAPEEERALLRSLLVANEINVHNNGFDYLGGLYMDALDLERSLVRMTELRIWSPDIEVLGARIRDLRAQIIGSARRSVMARRDLWPTLRAPLTAAAIAAVTGFAAMWAWLSGPLWTGKYTTEETLAFSLVTGAALAVVGGVGTWFWLSTRRSPQEVYWSIIRDLNSLRADVTVVATQTGAQYNAPPSPAVPGS